MINAIRDCIIKRCQHLKSELLDAYSDDYPRPSHHNTGAQTGRIVKLLRNLFVNRSRERSRKKFGIRENPEKRLYPTRKRTQAYLL